MSTDEASDVERRVRELLAGVYTSQGIDVWLGARNRSLPGGESPRVLLDCCPTGAEAVLAEAERVAGAS